VIAESIGCLCKCNQHIFFAIGSGANAAFIYGGGYAAQMGRRRRAIPTLGLRGALMRRGAAAPFEKQKVGPPRRRGPKIQARMRRFFTGAAALRKSDGGGAPSLPWDYEGR
jgi:hypothetical protein